MQITGHFSELPWSDLLRFLDLSQQDGCLTIRCASDNGRLAHCTTYYFWISQGCFVGVARRLNGHGLLKLIQHRGLLSYQAGERLASTLPVATPLGHYLKQQGVLTAKQLRELFHDQVLGPIQAVATLKDGAFTFETLSSLPQMELTGLMLPIYEVQKCLTLNVA